MNGEAARDLRKNFNCPTRAYAATSGQHVCQTSHDVSGVKLGRPCEKCGAVK